MASSYTYALSAFTNATALNIPVDPQRLTKELATSSITTALFYLNINAANVVFTFVSALTAPQITTLNGIVAAHPNNSVAPPTTYTTDPTVNDEESKGYFAGDTWINYSTKTEWNCVNGYENNAEWLKKVKALGDFYDVGISGLTAGEILPYKNTFWVNSTPLTSYFSGYKNIKYVNSGGSFAAPAQTTTRNNNNFIQLTGLTMDTSNTLGLTMDYNISFTTSVACNDTTRYLDIEIRVGGTAIPNSLRQTWIEIATHVVVIPVNATIKNVASGTAITIFIRRAPGIGGPGAPTFTFYRSSLCIIGT